LLQIFPGYFSTRDVIKLLKKYSSPKLKKAQISNFIRNYKLTPTFYANIPQTLAGDTLCYHIVYGIYEISHREVVTLIYDLIIHMYESEVKFMRSTAYKVLCVLLDTEVLYEDIFTNFIPTVNSSISFDRPGNIKQFRSLMVSIFRPSLYATVSLGLEAIYDTYIMLNKLKNIRKLMRGFSAYDFVITNSMNNMVHNKLSIVWDVLFLISPWSRFQFDETNNVYDMISRFDYDDNTIDTIIRPMADICQVIIFVRTIFTEMIPFGKYRKFIKSSKMNSIEHYVSSSDTTRVVNQFIHGLNNDAFSKNNQYVLFKLLFTVIPNKHITRTKNYITFIDVIRKIPNICFNSINWDGSIDTKVLYLYYCKNNLNFHTPSLFNDIIRFIIMDLKLENNTNNSNNVTANAAIPINSNNANLISINSSNPSNANNQSRHISPLNIQLEQLGITFSRSLEDSLESIIKVITAAARSRKPISNASAILLNSEADDLPEYIKYLEQLCPLHNEIEDDSDIDTITKAHWFVFCNFLLHYVFTNNISTPQLFKDVGIILDEITIFKFLLLGVHKCRKVWMLIPYILPFEYEKYTSIYEMIADDESITRLIIVNHSIYRNTRYYAKFQSSTVLDITLKGRLEKQIGNCLYGQSNTLHNILKYYNALIQFNDVKGSDFYIKRTLKYVLQLHNMPGNHYAKYSCKALLRSILGSQEFLPILQNIIEIDS
jgi:hypothetical protein